MPIQNFQIVAANNRPVGSDYMDSTSPYYLVSVLQDIKATVRAQELATPWVTLLGLTGNWTGGLAWTQNNGTTATIQGDQTASGTGYLSIGQRVRAFVTAGTLYGQITNLGLTAGNTVVSFLWDSGALDSGLTDIQTGGDQKAVPNSVVTQTQNPLFCIITNSGGGAWVGNLAPGISGAYKFGQVYQVQWSGPSVGNDTLNINAIGAVAIFKQGGAGGRLLAGDIGAGEITPIVFDGSNFQIQSPSFGGSGTRVLSGTGTFIVPAPTMIVDIYGGSGGGGGGTSGNGGGGGGAGARIRVILTGQTVGGTLAYATGAAGTAGPGNGNGGNGGASVFNGVTAFGGGGGNAGGTGGTGGIQQTGFPAYENVAGLNGTAGSGSGNAPGGLGPVIGGQGGLIGAGNAGSAGLPGLVIVTW